MTSLHVEGKGRIIAYPAGVLPSLMGRGLTYPQAKRELAHVAEFGAWKHNLVVTQGKVLVANFLRDASGYSTGLTYCEIGTDPTTPALSDTTLGSSSHRNAVTTTSITDAEFQVECFFTASECSIHVKEVGWFGGDGADGTTASGSLFSHYLENEDNSGGSKDLTFIYRCTVS